MAVVLDAARTRREALYEAVVGLEDALATPADDGPRWRLRVAMALDHAAARIGDHAAETEQPGGFFDRLVQAAPRLQRRVDQLVVDKERLVGQIDAMRLSVASVTDTEAAEQVPTIRNQATELLDQLKRHRQDGADLIYEAYKVDIGQH